MSGDHKSEDGPDDDGAGLAPGSADAPVLVYSTFPTLASAEAAAQAVLGQRLAACANILPGLVSIYEWQGAMQRDQEVAMILKTRAALADALVAAARRLHPYQNPAFVVLPVTGGSADFLAWIGRQTGSVP